jgi:enterochelin esterase-like enzyme
MPHYMRLTMMGVRTLLGLALAGCVAAAPSPAPSAQPPLGSVQPPLGSAQPPFGSAQPPFGTATPPGGETTPTPAASSASAACLQDGTLQHQAITYAAGAEPLRLQVYLPPCYAQQPGARYPVLYLLHGAGGDEYTWTTSGRFEQAANSLIRGGRVPPFIAVMPHLVDGDLDGELLVEHLIPYVDATFRTRSERTYRSLGGASYGGMMSIKMAFKHPDLIARVGIFGHGLSQPDAERLAAWIDATPAEQWPRVLIDIGYHDPGMRYGQWLIAQLEAKGVPYWLLREEGRHSYDYWFGHLTVYLDWYAAGWQ